MVTGWSVDSRTLQPGDLFFALRGPLHDGHAYVAEVFEKGAVAAVVEETVGGRARVLRVDDTLRRCSNWRRGRAGNGGATW